MTRPILWLLLLAACGRNEPVAAAPTEPAPAPAKSEATPATTARECLPCDEAAGSSASSDARDALRLRPVSFAELPGWKDDEQHETLAAFARSCAKLEELAPDSPVGTGPFGGRASDWQETCRARPAQADADGARDFFQRYFKAYESRTDQGPEGKLTGYYLQPLRASRTASERYPFPLYARPADLVESSLSDFVSDGRSRRIWGRVDAAEKKLLPYPERRDWLEEGAPEVLLWVDDPADAVAVEIEGSGMATLEDGSQLHISFAGKNGRKSGRLGSIHRAMKELRASHRGENWGPAELERYWEIIGQKTSVVFFQLEDRPGAIGTQEVVLSPGRSLAVDRAAIPLSTPVWVSTRAPHAPGAPAKPWQRLLIAQDTGGAIIGSIRGDIYTGEDRAAMEVGRRINGPGRMWLLLPRSIKIPGAYLDQGGG